jgi:uncharacterized protein
MSEGWVWVDLENTPHVLFLEPIVRHLRRRGWDVRITARPQAQTLDLAAHRGLTVRAVGYGDFRGLGSKAVGVMARSAALTSWIARHGRPRLVVSCSRSASLTALILRLPGVALLDYEHAEQRLLAAGNRVIWFPDLLRDVALQRASKRIARFYDGLKENLYLDSWSLDRAAERRQLAITDDEYLIVTRPPAETAHYASDLSSRLWMAAVRALRERSRHRVLIVPRTDAQRAQVADELGRTKGVELLPTVVSGPALVVAADLVVGGGGTMNREAAVLGVPVWSVFTGPSPHIDEWLATEGRLRWVRNDAQLRDALAAELPALQPRRGPYPQGLAAILGDVEARLDRAKGVE